MKLAASQALFSSTKASDLSRHDTRSLLVTFLLAATAGAGCREIVDGEIVSGPDSMAVCPARPAPFSGACGSSALNSA